MLEEGLDTDLQIPRGQWANLALSVLFWTLSISSVLGLKLSVKKDKKRGHFVTHNTCFPGATTNVLEFSQLETCLSLLLKVA